MTIEKNISLKNFNTFKTGGVAAYFVRVKNLDDLKEALNFAKEKKLPFFALGGGSNILLAEGRLEILAIKIEIGGFEIAEDESDKNSVLISAGAGESWDSLVQCSVGKNFYGLENLSGIPGTVGASPVQNIGAYGSEVSKTIFEVEAFDARSFALKKFSNSDCWFGYRDSFFKTEEGRNFIITKVSFRLAKTGRPDIAYKDLEEFFRAENAKDSKDSEKNPSLAEVRAAVLAIRKKKLPDLKKYGTAGSFFKNPVIPKNDFEKLAVKFPEMPHFPSGAGSVKIPAAWLLDKICGLKGFRRGEVGSYESQPLVIVNYGKADSEEVKKYAEYAQALVKEKTGIEISPEVEFVGF